MVDSVCFGGLMKQLLIRAIAVAGLIGTPAFAADMAVKMPVKAPPPAVAAPVLNWTSFYVGGTVGAAWTKADVSMTTVNNTGILYDPLDIPSLNAFGSPGMSRTNAIFGAKAGYNQQWNAFVLGLEGDISWFHFDQTVTNVGNPFVTFPGSGSAQISTNVETSWLATIRGRAGFALDHWLFYGTGGAAFANVKYSNSYKAFSPHGAGFDFEAATASETEAGWAAGGGIDYAINPHLILSAEYLHVDLGTITASGGVTTQFAARTATFNFSTRVTSDLVRVGAAYKF
jgi:outer membrane immunogenic protein